MTLLPGEAGAGGYRRLGESASEPILVRTDLGGLPPGAGLKSLLSFVHLSDLHVTDAQSPARAEFLDRLGDPDQPTAPLVGRVGTYRAQEALTHHVLEAMTAAVRRGPAGPATGAPPAFAISTGDNTDNAQHNELAAYLDLLDGGAEVVPDSGDRSRFEGVGSADAYDVRYWHPDGTPAGQADDLPRSLRGFPVVPGLLDACRRPFRSGGLGLPWYAVYGNHDSLFGGTIPPVATLAALALGGEKPTRAVDGTDLVALLAGNEIGAPPHAWGLLACETRPVTPDPSRRPLGAQEWIAGHLERQGQPFGHGFDESARDEGRAYYGFDAGPVRVLVLDTVNRAGGWQGSLDESQLAWLEEELVAGHSHFLTVDGRRVAHDAGDRLFLLFSHHPLDTLINGYAPDGSRRVLGPELARLLARFANLVAWLNGHTHIHKIVARPASASIARAPGGFWEVTTASHVDWPQQSRLVELAWSESTGDLVLSTTTLDHAGPSDPRAGELSDPLTLASWSRELSLNAWQGRASVFEPLGRGCVEDRNVTMVLPAPFALRAGAR